MFQIGRNSGVIYDASVEAIVRRSFSPKGEWLCQLFAATRGHQNDKNLCVCLSLLKKFMNYYSVP